MTRSVGGTPFYGGWEATPGEASTSSAGAAAPSLPPAAAGSSAWHAQAGPSGTAMRSQLLRTYAEGNAEADADPAGTASEQAQANPGRPMMTAEGEHNRAAVFAWLGLDDPAPAIPVATDEVYRGPLSMEDSMHLDASALLRTGQATKTDVAGKLYSGSEPLPTHWANRFTADGHLALGTTSGTAFAGRLFKERDPVVATRMALTFSLSEQQLTKLQQALLGGADQLYQRYRDSLPSQNAKEAAALLFTGPPAHALDPEVIARLAPEQAEQLHPALLQAAGPAPEGTPDAGPADTAARLAARQKAQRTAPSEKSLSDDHARLVHAHRLLTGDKKKTIAEVATAVGKSNRWLSNYLTAAANIALGSSAGRALARLLIEQPGHALAQKGIQWRFELSNPQLGKLKAAFQGDWEDIYRRCMDAKLDSVIIDLLFPDRRERAFDPRQLERLVPEQTATLRDTLAEMVNKELQCPVPTARALPEEHARLVQAHRLLTGEEKCTLEETADRIQTQYQWLNGRLNVEGNIALYASSGLALARLLLDDPDHPFAQAGVAWRFAFSFRQMQLLAKAIEGGWEGLHGRCMARMDRKSRPFISEFLFPDRHTRALALQRLEWLAPDQVDALLDQVRRMTEPVQPAGTDSPDAHAIAARTQSALAQLPGETQATVRALIAAHAGITGPRHLSKIAAMTEAGEGLDFHLTNNGHLNLQTTAGRALARNPAIREILLLNGLRLQLGRRQAGLLRAAFNGGPQGLFDRCVALRVERLTVHLLFPDPATRALDPQGLQHLRDHYGLPFAGPQDGAATAPMPIRRTAYRAPMKWQRLAGQPLPWYDMAQLLQAAAASGGDAHLYDHCRHGVHAHFLNELFPAPQRQLDWARLQARAPDQATLLRATLGSGRAPEIRGYHKKEMNRFLDAYYDWQTQTTEGASSALSLQACCFNRGVSYDFMLLVLDDDFNLDITAIQRLDTADRVNFHMVREGDAPDGYVAPGNADDAAWLDVDEALQMLDDDEDVDHDGNLENEENVDHEDDAAFARFLEADLDEAAVPSPAPLAGQKRKRDESPHDAAMHTAADRLVQQFHRLWAYRSEYSERFWTEQVQLLLLDEENELLGEPMLNLMCARLDAEAGERLRKIHTEMKNMD